MFFSGTFDLLLINSSFSSAQITQIKKLFSAKSVTSKQRFSLVFDIDVEKT